MNRMCFVIILESLSDPDRHYTGLTDDPSARLQKHNEGGVPHTSKYKPWRFRVVLGFPSREQAAQFESYLKSHAGRTFASKRF